MKPSYWNSVRDSLPKNKDWVVVRAIDMEDSDFYYAALYCKDFGWKSLDQQYRSGFIVTDWTVPPFINFKS